MGHPNKDAIVAILRDLARQLQAMNDDDIERVLAGKAKLQLGIQTGRRPPQPKQGKLSSAQLEKLAEALQSTGSRQEGAELLERLSSKDELVRLARHLDLPVQKNDSAQQLRSRVIESTVGFRLRSAAIQGSSSASSNERKQ